MARAVQCGAETIRFVWEGQSERVSVCVLLGGKDKNEKREGGRRALSIRSLSTTSTSSTKPDGSNGIGGSGLWSRLTPPRPPPFFFDFC